MNGHELDRRAVEAWFRRRGLPLVVRQDRRGSALLQRAIPALVFLLTLDPLVSLLALWADRPRGELEALLANPAFVVGQLVVVAVAALVLPALVAWLVTRWRRRLDASGRRVLAIAVLVLNVPVLPVIDRAVGLRDNVWVSLTINVGATLLVLLAVYVGAGSILAWGLRHAVRQLGTVGTMATKALPLLVLVVMFAFFSTEMWQIADALPRYQLWSVVALLAGLSVLFMIATQADELREMTDRASAGGLDDLAGQLRDTPFAGLTGGEEAVAPQPLSRSERANVTVVLFVAQALQIAVLALLVFVLFVLFGALAIRESVVVSWLGEGLASGRLFGIELPVSRALVQVSIFLSVFSGLYFTASAATDPHYRKAFFDPLLAEVRTSLAVRQVYLARRAVGSYPGMRTVTDR
ncbi:hypothetical protein BLA60_25970 [Actinophytocola xinjiangensis]|uniref:Integral membrane protein n=1 Tax=Actinophytocola xinjiangensis TaxID=485602 RepID=A0A7Z0WI81_9PSEU|nr:hypothetical protein [Actinophytocola xinjiangensis]OLF07775.1 hypothetical protein BLA60_25970 [Actinophytocola xinjiangensis]